MTSPYKNQQRSRIIVEKQAMPVTRFIRQNSKWRSLRHRRCSMLIGHVRMATHGDPNDPVNAHPFSSKDGKLHVVHNGIIFGHRVIARRLGVHLTTDCDSEILLRIIERAKHPATGLEEALRQLHGSIAAAVLDVEHHMVWLAQNGGRSLWLMKLRDGRYFFASEKSILLKALKRVMGKGYEWAIELLIPVAANHVHALHVDGVVALREVS